MSDWLNDYEEIFGSQIDFLLVNSCLWDINRWGPTGPEDFKTNLSTMVSDVPGILAPGGHCVWLTSPPGTLSFQTSIKQGLANSKSSLHRTVAVNKKHIGGP